MWSRRKSKINISVELDSISKDNDPRTNATKLCSVMFIVTSNSTGEKIILRSLVTQLIPQYGISSYRIRN